MRKNNEKTPVRLVFFDPPMCCSTGLCGPSVDDRLVQLQADIEAMKAAYPNLII